MDLRGWFHIFVFSIAFVVAPLWVVSATAAELSIRYLPDSIELSGSEPTPPGFPIVSLRQSSDLSSWREIGRFRERLYPYLLPIDAESKATFFQMAVRRPLATDDWASQLVLPDSGLIAHPEGAGLSKAPFAKFTIELSNPERVFFQDSSKFPFHYSFIRERMKGYENLGFLDFERVALRKEGQELVLGTILVAPDPSIAELAVQFAGQEPFDVVDVIDWYQTTVQRLAFVGKEYRVFYMPTFEQRDVTFANEAVFAARGVPVDSPVRWSSDSVCYSDGWALGRLRVIPADEIDAAYGSGRLGVTDILVTDFVPAEIPVVAGVVSFHPATPNSHVVLLARSTAVPLASVSGAGLQSQIEAWAGEEVLLTVSNDGDECELLVQNVEGKLSDEQRAAILALKAPSPVEIQGKETAGQLWLPTENLRGDAIRFVGGKAANFGVLRRSLPAQSPKSIAFTFDLWDRFMEQPTDSGESLGRWIADALAPYDSYPPNVSSLRGILQMIQDRIRDETTFSPELRAGVIEGLELFASDQKIRFRSSTNVEDSEQFSGAGLYDSFSGCLLDDLDANSTGPSHCDASKSKERGVFRAIRKVFASFYNENAFLERLRHGVDESDVAMGLLVHHSFPDPLEMANGVATLDIREAPDGDRRVELTMVTQLGATSVANPDSQVLPEVVRLREGEIELTGASSLVPVGETVLEWEADYRELSELLNRAALEFEDSLVGKDRLLLDFEYKKIVPGDLIVKQIRVIPQIPPVPPPSIELILD